MRTAFVLGLLGAMALVGCGSSTTTESKDCVPDSTEPCTCPDGERSFRLCGEDRILGDCRCEGTAGMSGGGGEQSGGEAGSSAGRDSQEGGATTDEGGTSGASGEAVVAGGQASDGGHTSRGGSDNAGEAGQSTAGRAGGDAGTAGETSGQGGAVDGGASGAAGDAELGGQIGGEAGQASIAGESGFAGTEATGGETATGGDGGSSGSLVGGGPSDGGVTESGGEPGWGGSGNESGSAGTATGGGAGSGGVGAGGDSGSGGTGDGGDPGSGGTGTGGGPSCSCASPDGMCVGSSCQGMPGTEWVAALLGGTLSGRSESTFSIGNVCNTYEPPRAGAIYTFERDSTLASNASIRLSVRFQSSMTPTTAFVRLYVRANAVEYEGADQAQLAPGANDTLEFLATEIPEADRDAITSVEVRVTSCVQVVSYASLIVEGIEVGPP